MVADLVPPVSWIPRLARLALACMVAAAAAQAAAAESAPSDPSRPWIAPDLPAEWRKLATEGTAGSAGAFVAQAPQPGRVYDLPALIDLAQINNPETRVAWSEARQAAAAVGLTESVFLPRLSASVVGGYVATRWQPEVLGEKVRVDTSARGVVPMLTLEWLLFDFGQRAATDRAARDLSLGANYLFNAMHQKLVYDVTRRYYEYGTARLQREIADATLANSQAVEAAVVARRDAGLATSVEEALGRQLVAQAKLRKVNASGLERSTWQTLLATLGLPPDTRLNVAGVATIPLPATQQLAHGAVLERALAGRPDVLASIASLKAAENAVEAARADFLPKVFLMGFLLGGNGNMTIGPLSDLVNSSATRGILLGVTVPLYDGGMRNSRLHGAQERVTAAQATLEKLRNAAMSEIVVANNLLETALQSYEAATTLVETATISYDAALDSYREGLGTVTVATEAANGLLTARSAQADAHAAALVAAASLAFALGQLEDGRSIADPAGRR